MKNFLNNKKVLSLYYGIFITIINILPYKQQAICTYDMLINDILGDFYYNNGKLECLLSSSNSNTYVWKSDCGLKWMKKLWPSILGTYKIEGLYNSSGEKLNNTTNSFDDQSSICQLVRALMYEGKMNFKLGIDNVETIKKEIMNSLKCVGNYGQTNVCVATASSFNDVKSVVPFVNGDTIRINGIPNYIQNNN